MDDIKLLKFCAIPILQGMLTELNDNDEIFQIRKVS